MMSLFSFNIPSIAVLFFAVGLIPVTSNIFQSEICSFSSYRVEGMVGISVAMNGKWRTNSCCYKFCFIAIFLKW
jgi:hypothetical protein